MIANVTPPRAFPLWHEQFLTMLPAITTHAETCFRNRKCEAREELVHEVIVNCLVAFERLVRLGRANLAYPSTLARYGVAQGDALACGSTLRTLRRPTHSGARALSSNDSTNRISVMAVGRKSWSRIAALRRPTRQPAGSISKPGLRNSRPRSGGSLNYWPRESAPQRLPGGCV